jgi:hypothetical protein
MWRHMRNMKDTAERQRTTKRVTDLGNSDEEGCKSRTICVKSRHHWQGPPDRLIVSAIVSLTGYCE